MTAEALRQRALRLLARREHSRAELLARLAAEAPRAMLEDLLDRLAERGLQSDRRFAEQFVRNRAPRMGRARIARELAQRGIHPELCAAALAEALPEDEYVRATRVWHARFGAPPADPREWARQARFLQYRGFSSEIIRKVIREAGE